MKGKMRASSASLTGWLSLRGDEDEPSVRACLCMCMCSVPSCVCTPTTASSCHCQHLMELLGGQHFIISVAPVNSAAIIHCVRERRCEQVSPCTARCPHRCRAPSHVNITRKRPVIGNAASSCYRHSAEVKCVLGLMPHLPVESS